VFVCLKWCPTYIVLCFCFVFLRLGVPMLPVSLDGSFLFAPSVFSNVLFQQILNYVVTTRHIHGENTYKCHELIDPYILNTWCGYSISQPTSVVWGRIGATSQILSPLNHQGHQENLKIPKE
jgi:hypothetical protein